jgi:iron complex transport system substrate-binding protein
MIKNLMTQTVLAIAMCLCSAVSFAQSFPLTIEHKFGETTIPAKPSRVASVDYGGQDNLLALGVQPIVMRYWWGEHPYGVWKWAEPYFKSEPVLLKGDMDFEAIAAEKPDVIIALYSGIDEVAYNKLSLIAPVIAVPAGIGDYNLAWDKRALLTGRALGLEAEAKAQIKAIDEKLAAAAAAHPDWQGKSLVMVQPWADGVSISAYSENNMRSHLFAQLGFATTAEVNALAAKNPDKSYVMLSAEDPSPLNADLIIWELEHEERRAQILNLAMYSFLDATKEGREVFVGHELSGAFSHLSLLSLPYAIDNLVPMIEAALDGDPETHADNRS